jgi:hypothetical protein
LGQSSNRKAANKRVLEKEAFIRERGMRREEHLGRTGYIRTGILSLEITISAI